MRYFIGNFNRTEPQTSRLREILDNYFQNTLYRILAFKLKERIAAFASHFPSGVSTWVLAHFLQLSGSERFAKFDYGKVNNIIRYGQTFPPDYPLHKINLRRISIFYSLNDAISQYNNVLMIKKFLKGIDEKSQINFFYRFIELFKLLIVKMLSFFNVL